MIRHASSIGEVRNANKILIATAYEKRSLRRPTRRCEGKQAVLRLVYNRILQCD